MREVTAFSDHNHDGYANPKKSLCIKPSVHKLSSLPSITHYWEELLPNFPLIIGSYNELAKLSDFYSRPQPCKSTK